MKTNLRMKCGFCGRWNRFEVEKVSFKQATSEAKVRTFIPLYLPFKTEVCALCGYVLAKEKKLIKIVKNPHNSQMCFTGKIN
jgi:hypothetical protein